ncbi:Msr family ABC-F type ribosomal protection protein [Lysinibacillus sp. NPDC097287]|uniref:Msr family ABC-F type ribosomal protection protein n=1 Tax=Lysinibacillus sp. NPDC097287 TaxID=3364144 RepID=UPI0038093910
MEKICFELENINVTFLDKEVLSIDRLTIHQFDRIGIIGKNGAGKSTLLKLLASEISPTTGVVKQYVDLGYFEQMEVPTDKEVNIVLQSKLGARDAHSGGEQTRLKLAQLFTNYYEALLIDEPTTHLDQQGVNFVKEELKYYFGALVLISHDRDVLDELVTTIWEVVDGKVNVYTGNYSDYVIQKEQERWQQKQAYEQYQQEKNRLEKAAEQKMKKAEKIANASNKAKKDAKAKPNRMIETKSKGTSQKAVHRAAKAIEKRKEKLQEVEAMKETQPIFFKQGPTIEMHNKFPIMADGLTIQIKNRVLLKDVRFQIPLGEKVAITGPNGCGKSTLLNDIVANGEGISLSPKVKIGQFQQLSYQHLKDESVWLYMKSRTNYEDTIIRSVLHAMQFSGSDLQKSIRHLSGGEAIRLQLCELFLGEYNILILDEPTNFLDIEAIQALELFMQNYKGTILFVSHDRQFVERVANRCYRIEHQQLIEV